MPPFKEVAKSVFFLIIMVILAIWLSPIILVIGILYLGYRIRRFFKRRNVIKKVREVWFPKGKCAFFMYSDSKKWKEYLETELIPQIKDRTAIWNWSTRRKTGWNEDLLDYQVLKLFRGFGYFYPIGIVFLPSGEVKTFQFYDDYFNFLKGKGEYKNKEKEFVDLVNSIKI